MSDDRENELWDAPIELLQGEGSPLSTPKPDYSFGLAIDRSGPFPTALMDPQSAPVLSDAFLSHLQVTTRLQPWLATGIVDMVFPCIIHEAKSDSSTLFFAENQVAGAAAKALIVLEELCSAASSEIRLPVIGFCSQGYNWEVWVAFRGSNRKIVSHSKESLVESFISFMSNSLPCYSSLANKCSLLFINLSTFWNLCHAFRAWY